MCELHAILRFPFFACVKSPAGAIIESSSVIEIVLVGMAAWTAVRGISRVTVEELDHQVDSGMGSSDARSPEVKSLLPDDEDDDEEDESLTERLLGLTEMFPEPVRNFGYNVGTCLYTCIKGLYAYSCSATWLVFSSSTILFAPIIFEMERAQMEDLQRTQQKQVLLGPNTALSGVNTTGLPIAPPVQR